MKWSRTKHLETAKNSSLKVLSITTGEQGQFAWSLPGNITVINDCYLNNCLFCHERTPMSLHKAFTVTELVFLSVHFSGVGGFMFHTLSIVILYI